MGADFLNYPFAGKRVLVRVDFNVPFDKQTGLVSDDTRIRSAVPTIRHIAEQGGRVILLSHLGRPKGVASADFSLDRIVQLVSQLVGKSVRMVSDCCGDEVSKVVNAMRDGDVVLLENLRFHAEEEAKVSKKEGESDAELSGHRAAMQQKAEEFTKALFALGDCYVNDAFGTAHRGHSSNWRLPALFAKGDRMFGLLFSSELEALSRITREPQRPLTAIMGGAKVSDKILLIQNLLPKINRLIVGGGMAYTFIKAQGGEIGQSICESDLLDTALGVIAKAKELGVELLLPVDAQCGTSFAADSDPRIYPIDETPVNRMGMDIGPDSIAKFHEAIVSSKTIFWNGPMGVFEFAPYATGTLAIAKALAEATRHGAYTLVGGGDSLAAVKLSGLQSEISYLSTGGGAMLEYLEGKELPGVSAIGE